MAGIFTISLDFELHWGVFDKKSVRDREHVYRNTLNLIPEMLQMFEEYNVHVTWATVGSMFAANEQEWNKLRPQIEPEYSQSKYSAYNWVRVNGLSDEHKWAYFSPESIRMIMNTEGQELATHTFSHYYCLEQQSAVGAFDSDLLAVRNAAKPFNAKLSSLVFPRNQFNPGYLKTCYKNGITAIRSNPDTWFWKPVNERGSGLIRKVIRTSDAYMQLGNQRTSYPLSSIKVTADEPLQLPASRFFRPWRSRYKFANTLRLNHMCSELKKAAVHDECYHLWFHPENFGEHPQENMRNLQQLLARFRKCQNRYGMESWNMSEYVDKLVIPVQRSTEHAYTSEAAFQ